MSMPNSLVKHLQDRIADAKHDIESIEMHLVKQNESSISADQVQGLRGLQKMYRKRIVKLDAEIATVPNPGQDNSGSLQGPVHSGMGSSEITSLKGSRVEHL
jgi:Tfp pilus assembly protein PilW